MGGGSYPGVHRWKGTEDVPIKASLHKGTEAILWGPMDGLVLLEHQVRGREYPKGKQGRQPKRPCREAGTGLCTHSPAPFPSEGHFPSIGHCLPIHRGGPV